MSHLISPACVNVTFCRPLKYSAGLRLNHRVKSMPGFNSKMNSMGICEIVQELRNVLALQEANLSLIPNTAYGHLSPTRGDTCTQE